MNDLEKITKFELLRQFKSVRGNDVLLIGTGNVKVSEADANGYCTCGYKYRVAGVCVRCYLLGTIDVIRVNGVSVAGGYRRGTVLKMAGLVSSELNEICYDDSVVAVEKVFSQFNAGAVKENYYRKEMELLGNADGARSNTVDDNEIIELR